MRRSRSKTPSFRLKPITAVLLCSTAWAGHALAQTDDEAAATESQVLSPLSVTGMIEDEKPISPKFTAPLLDTPQTVSIIPSELFNQQGAQTLTDVLKNTPGISFSGGENGFAASSNTFSLRGFDASSHVFIDGARDSGTHSRDIFNIEQVEVAKGAASDNGRGGAGGYLNLVTKSPGLENFVSGSASYGLDEYSSEDRRRVTADANQRLGENTAVRFNLLWSDGGKPGRDVTELKTYGVAPSIAFGLDTRFRTVLSYQYMKQDDIPDYGVPGITIPGTHWNGLSDHDYSNVNRDRYYGSVSDFNEVDAHSGLLRFEYDLSGDTTISNRTRWSDTEHRALFTQISNADPAATATTAADANVNRYRAGYWRDNTSISNLSNLSTSFMTGQFRHSVAAGVELSREETDAVRQGLIGVPAADDLATSIYEPNNGPLAGALDPNGDTSAINIDTLAAYVYDTVQLNERWQVTGGLRVERYEVDIKASNPAADLEGSETTVGGKLGVVYKPADNGAIYASVSRSSELPGDYLSTPDISRTGGNGLPGLVEGINDPNNKPRVSLNYEIGTKWDLFNERLLLSAAAFITEKRNVTMTGKDDAADADATLKGYGRQIVEGIELGASGKITDAWDVFGGVVLLDSQRKHSRYLDQVRCNDRPGDYGGDGLPAAVCGITGSSGDRLAFTPEVSANLWTTYRTATGLTLGLGGQYVGDQVAGRPSDAERIVKNGKYGGLPSYTVFNALVSYPVQQNLTLRLNIDNLFDEQYATAANWPVQTVELSNSRAFLLSADYRF